MDVICVLKKRTKKLMMVILSEIKTLCCISKYEIFFLRIKPEHLFYLLLSWIFKSQKSFTFLKNFLLGTFNHL